MYKQIFFYFFGQFLMMIINEAINNEGTYTIIQNANLDYDLRKNSLMHKFYFDAKSKYNV